MCTPIHIADELQERLQNRHRVTVPWSDDPTRGVGGAAFDALLDRWANEFDWGVHERRIDALPWQSVRSDEIELRFVHQRSADPDAPVVVLLHGWPDSVLRFERVLPLLADFHVVVPALPGFPFAPPLTTPGMSAFPQDVIPAPRSYAEAFLNVVEYIEHPAGGHFAAWEQPSAYTEDVRRALKVALP
jgi:pimeloyl-ACP methyl ester carboxylesterase